MVAAVRVEDPGRLADTIAAHLLRRRAREARLARDHFPDRTTHLHRRNPRDRSAEASRFDRRVQSRVKQQMEKGQKEYYLNEKMKAIQKELGRKDDKGTESR